MLKLTSSSSVAFLGGSPDVYTTLVARGHKLLLSIQIPTKLRDFCQERSLFSLPRLPEGSPYRNSGTRDPWEDIEALIVSEFQAAATTPTNLYERLTFPDSTPRLTRIRFEYG